jgi:hypothetical protein
LFNIFEKAKLLGTASLFLSNMCLQHELRESRKYKLLWYMITLQSKETKMNKNINIKKNIPKYEMFDQKILLKEFNKLNNAKLVINYILDKLQSQKNINNVIVYERFTLSKPVEYYIGEIIKGKICSVNKELVEEFRLENEKKK